MAHGGEPGADPDYHIRTAQAQEDEGMARLEHDVVPPDQQALGLVDAILREADTKTFTAQTPGEVIRQASARLGIIQGNAERLKVLLTKQPALLAALKSIATWSTQADGARAVARTAIEIAEKEA